MSSNKRPSDCLGVGCGIFILASVISRTPNGGAAAHRHRACVGCADHDRRPQKSRLLGHDLIPASAIVLRGHFGPWYGDARFSATCTGKADRGKIVVKKASINFQTSLNRPKQSIKAFTDTKPPRHRAFSIIVYPSYLLLEK